MRLFAATTCHAKWRHQSDKARCKETTGCCRVPDHSRGHDPLSFTFHFLNKASVRSICLCMSCAASTALLFSLFPNCSRCASSGPSAILTVLTCAHIAANGVSWHIPCAPYVCTALSMTSSAMFGTRILACAISTSADLASPASIAAAALRTIRRAASMSMRALAIQCRITPCSESCLSKGLLCGAFARVRSQRRASSA